MYRLLLPVIPATVLMALIAGCSSDDELLRQSLQRQAEQNAQMARHTELMVETSRDLIAADSRARGELVRLQQNLQEDVETERQSLDRQHEEMEAERQAVARQRLRDPLIAAAIVNAAVLLACIAPLLLAFWVLRQSWGQESAGVDELLIHELTTETPVLLPRPTLSLPAAEPTPEPAGEIEGPTGGAAQA